MDQMSTTELEHPSATYLPTMHNDSGRNILRRPLANRIQGLALALQMLRVGLVRVQLVGMVKSAVAIAVAGVVDVVVEEAGGLGGLGEREGGLVDGRERQPDSDLHHWGRGGQDPDTRRRHPLWRLDWGVEGRGCMK